MKLAKGIKLMELQMMHCWRARVSGGLGLVLATTALINGCASPQTLTVTQPVGPSRETVAPVEGALQVYSATETHADGDNTYYYPHTSYQVYDTSGHKVKFVPNHVGTMDQTPSVVFLAPGNYVVHAEAEGAGRVRIPVVVQARRTTVVHLERDWQPGSAASGQLVRLPDGQPIGWSCASSVAGGSGAEREQAQVNGQH